MSLVFFFMVIFSWLLSTLIHELGHALPSLWFTKGKVKIIIGVEKENDKNSISLYLGRLEIFLKLNPLRWRFGYCTHLATGKAAAFFILINGALTTFLCALALFIWFYNEENVHPWTTTFTYAFLLASVYDLYINLVPNRKPFYYNGIKMYNDGYQIKHRVFNGYAKYDLLVKRIEDQERFNQFLMAAVECEKAIEEMPKELYFYHKWLENISKTKSQPALLHVLTRIQATIGLDYYSFMHKGSYYLKEQDFEKAEANFNFALQEEPKADAYNNRGYTRGLMGKYKESVSDLNHAINLDHKSAFAFNNRGYAFMMLGNMYRAYEDLSHSMDLDPKNAYCYRNFGIYFLKKGFKEVALIFLKKARKMDDTVPMLEQYEKEATTD